MRRIFLPVLVILSVPFMNGFAQRMHGPDTLLFTLPNEIIVTALRLPTSLANAAAPIDVLRGEELRSAPARSVSDALAYTPGAVVRAYGGGGSLDIVSLRGLEAEYTVVLFNGVRLNNAQITTVDLDKLPLTGVRRIEVARGGYSSLYGADALGGIVSISTEDAVLNPYVSAGVGSFGYRQYEGGAGARFGATTLSVSGYYEEAQNDYPFTLSSGVEQIRARSNYHQRGMSLRGMTAGGGYTASLYALVSSTDAGTPGALTGVHQGYARQQDYSVVVSAPVRYAVSGSLFLQATPSVVFARQRYFDPELKINGEPLDAVYENTQYGLSLTVDQTLSSAVKLLYGTEAMLAALHSEEVAGMPQRVSLGAFVTGEWVVDDASRLRIIPALRGDLHRDAGNTLATDRLSPSLAAQYKLAPDYLTLRARYSAGYRIPTFNQLYWAEGGNPEIRPEMSTSFDYGVRITNPLLEGFALDLGYFRQDIDDKIVWRPGRGIYWTPMNIRRVVSYGAETSLSYSSPAFRADASAQWISSRQANEDFPGDEKLGKQLIYVPEINGAIRIHWNAFERTALSAAACFVGRRYYTSINDKYLTPYATVDAAVSQTVTFEGVRVLLKAEALNVFDESYEVTAFYPMPGRAFRISITTQLQ